MVRIPVVHRGMGPGRWFSLFLRHFRVFCPVWSSGVNCQCFSWTSKSGGFWTSKSGGFLALFLTKQFPKPLPIPMERAFLDKTRKSLKITEKQSKTDLFVKTPIQSLWLLTVLTVLTPLGHISTPRAGECQKVSKTPIQTPWKTSKMSVFHVFRVLKVAPLGVRFVGDILAKLYKIMNFHVFL